jgi:hypothetical protein
MASLTVKGQQASAAQAQNIVLLCKIGKEMGCNRSQLAGALATMMQESSCINMTGGDRDSAGLFQQRPSVGSWGTYAQVTDPVHAIKAFLTPYLQYSRQGYGPIVASDKVQRSAFPSAPAQWYDESWKDVGVVTGGKDFTDVTFGSLGAGGTNPTVVRNLPYEFSRGSPDKPENSWDCMGRLAQEVNWQRFMRGGSLWFVSEQWLAAQPPKFSFAVGTRGVIKIDFNADARRNAAECTVTALAKRWSVLPGDVVRVSGEGPADGLWLVSQTQRSLATDTTDITLKRPAPKLPEPAPQTSSSSVSVAGNSAPNLSGYNLKNAPNQAMKAYWLAARMSSWNIPYDKGQRNLIAHPPSADCSSSVSWVLLNAGFPLPGGVQAGGWAPVSGQFESWGQAGEGRYMTIECSAEHIWIRWHGLGNYWRFDTSPYGSGGYGPHMRTTARPTTGFVQRHWPNL